MKIDAPIILKRDCEAVLIPSGDSLKLRAGSQVTVTQSLGGSFTALTDRGLMVRIAGKDADALGVGQVTAARQGPLREAANAEAIEKMVWDHLKTCFDPEIPINIVDLGLIYQCRVIRLEKGEHRVEVRFTLTARGCGMGEVLKSDIKSKILGVPGIKEVDVELVWDPPWNQSMISDAAKIQLGMV